MNRYSNAGPCNNLLEERLAEFHGSNFCITFASGFWALVASIKYYALPRKTVALVPSFTYRRMADAVSWAGLKPKFCDVCNTNLGINAEIIAKEVDDDTAVIIAPHPVIRCLDVAGISVAGEDVEIPVVFDAVESVMDTVKGQKIGSFDNVEVFSLHASKMLNGAEGGYITTNCHEAARHFKLIRAFGLEGEDRIALAEGYNAKLNEMHAALALANLDNISEFHDHNQQNYEAYKQKLLGNPNLELHQYVDHENPGYKNILIKVIGDNSGISRDLLEKILNAENILARAYYSPPLHKREMEYEFQLGHLSVTEVVADQFLLLPSGYQCSVSAVEKICKLLDEIFHLEFEILQKFGSGDENEA